MRSRHLTSTDGVCGVVAEVRDLRQRTLRGHARTRRRWRLSEGLPRAHGTPAHAWAIAVPPDTSRANTPTRTASRRNVRSARDARTSVAGGLIPCFPCCPLGISWVHSMDPKAELHQSERSSGVYEEVAASAIPPRMLKFTVTFRRRGSRAATRSSLILVARCSWKVPSSRKVSR